MCKSDKPNNCKNNTNDLVGFKINLSEEVLSIKLHIGRENAKWYDIYHRMGGHVGVAFQGNVYHYYYTNPDEYHETKSNIFNTYKADFKITPEAEYNAPPIRVNGIVVNEGGDGYHGGGSDQYFNLYLSLGQYSALKNRIDQLSEAPTNVANYGFFGRQYGFFGKKQRRCASFAYYDILKASGISLGKNMKWNTFSPVLLYNKMIKKGYTPIDARQGNRNR